MTLWTVAAVLVLTGGAFAYRLAFASGERPDCPGKIVCPLTGELVCRDRCPLGAGGAKSETAPGCCPGEK